VKTRLKLRARRKELADAAESVVLVTNVVLVAGMKKVEVDTQLRAWIVWARLKKVGPDFDLRLTGLKQEQINRLTALIMCFGPVVDAILKAAGIGKNAEDDAIAGLVALTDRDEDECDYEDTEDMSEEIDNRVDQKWPDGFSFGQMG
jgi:hypothetical protein